MMVGWLFISLNAVLGLNVVGVGAEMSSHLIDKISDFTNMTMRALDVPYRGYLTRLSNFTHDPDYMKPSQMYFYRSMIDFPQIQNMYAGFDNGLFYGYFVVSSQNQRFVFSHTSSTNGINNIHNHMVSHDGAAVGDSLYNHTFDPRNQPWYEAAMDSKQAVWTEPYIDAGSGDPCLTLVIPIDEDSSITERGTSKRSRFIGALGVDILLEAISSFVINEFADTNRKFFIVDKTTLCLLGTNLDARLYSGPEKAKKIILAADSENAMIASASKLLISQGWPAEAVLFEHDYLQTSEYRDSIEGLEWYIVELLTVEVLPVEVIPVDVQGDQAKPAPEAFEEEGPEFKESTV